MYEKKKVAIDDFTGTILHDKVYLSLHFPAICQKYKLLVRSVGLWMGCIKSGWVNLKGSFLTFCTENCKYIL